MTTALFLLRCAETGLSMSDLGYLTVGMVFDMWTEKGNDEANYQYLASQDDFNSF